MPTAARPLTDARRRAPAAAASRPASRAGRTILAGLLLVLGAALAGCAQEAQASGPVMELATAYVGQPQHADITYAYLVIRNTGPADRLVGGRTSAGGTVTLVGPGPHGPRTMRTVSSIRMPGYALVRLAPNSYHLMITGARPMKAGRDITLTLRFARAGAFRVQAEVTNPQTGGSSYFLN